MVTGFKRYYAVGEKRRIDFKIIKNDSDDLIVITSAKFEILKDGNVIKSGNADINGEKVGILFEASSEGSYLIRFYVTIPPETIEAELAAEVKGG